MEEGELNNNKKIISGSFVVLLIAMGIGFGLSACGKKEPTSHAIYNCEGGVTLDVLFTGGQNVTITKGDKTYKLDRVPYESGARYEGGPFEFISMGVSGKYTEKGRSIQCRRD